MTITSSYHPHGSESWTTVLIKSFDKWWQFLNLFNVVFNVIMIVFINANPFSALALTLGLISFIMNMHVTYNTLKMEESLQPQRGGSISD